MFHSYEADENSLTMLQGSSHQLEEVMESELSESNAVKGKQFDEDKTFPPCNPSLRLPPLPAGGGVHCSGDMLELLHG